MTTRAFLASVSDVLDAVHRWESWRLARGGTKLSSEERDLLGAWHRYQTQKQRPPSLPPPRIEGFSPDEAPTKQRSLPRR